MNQQKKSLIEKALTLTKNERKNVGLWAVVLVTVSLPVIWIISKLIDLIDVIIKKDYDSVSVNVPNHLNFDIKKNNDSKDNNVVDADFSNKKIIDNESSFIEKKKENI